MDGILPTVLCNTIDIQSNLLKPTVSDDKSTIKSNLNTKRYIHADLVRYESLTGQSKLEKLMKEKSSKVLLRYKEIPRSWLKEFLIFKLFRNTLK